MESTNREILSQKIESAKERIANALIPVERLKDKEAREILGRYRVAIEPNFIAWMTQAYQNCRSERARKVLWQNIYDEITQDHPKMLRNFITECKVEITPSIYERVANSVLDIWNVFSNKNSLQNITIAAILENTSPIFIPYLAAIGRKLECKDFTYTDTHGLADIEHARELYEGTLEEMKHANNAWSTISNTTDKTISFLEKIFIL